MEVVIICLRQKDTASLANTNVNHHVTKINVISFVFIHVISILLCTLYMDKNGRVYFPNGNVCFHSSFIKHGQQGTARKHTGEAKVMCYHVFSTFLCCCGFLLCFSTFQCSTRVQCNETDMYKLILKDP